MTLWMFFLLLIDSFYDFYVRLNIYLMISIYAGLLIFIFTVYHYDYYSICTFFLNFDYSLYYFYENVIFISFNLKQNELFRFQLIFLFVLIFFEFQLHICHGINYCHFCHFNLLSGHLTPNTHETLTATTIQ